MLALDTEVCWSCISLSHHNAQHSEYKNDDRHMDKIQEGGWQPEDGNKEDIAEYVRGLLVSKAAMLEEYFQIRIDENGE